MKSASEMLVKALGVRQKYMRYSKQDFPSYVDRLSSNNLEKRTKYIFAGSLQRTKERNTARKAQQRDIQELQYKVYCNNIVT